MTRLRRNTTLAWPAGTVGAPVAEGSYAVQNFQDNVLDAVRLTDVRLVGEFSPGPTRPGGNFAIMSFESEFRGSDTADVPPPEGALLRACGFAETVNGTTPNIGYKYTLGDPHLTTGDPSGDLLPIALNAYPDGEKYQALNCVGNAIFSFVAGQNAKIAWVFRGQYSDSIKSAIKGTQPTFSAGAKPVPVRSEALTLAVTQSGTVTGTATNSPGNGTDLTDGAATFITDGVLIGDAITNDTDGSSATVAAVLTETTITTVALSGGVDDEWQTSDAYTITRTVNVSETSIICPSLVINPGAIIDERPDISGEHGFGPPIITGFNTSYALNVEKPGMDVFNFERAYNEGTTLKWTWTHEAGLGDRHAMTGSFSAKIAAMPRTFVEVGKIMLGLELEQAIEAGDTKLNFSWQGT